ncbi:zf-HC2 domain-containing protein [Cohnella candidum]|uniref:Anti-sigma-W factor RsiW n=1 Tax=Cohnella candidum TaxID=2674991 RepID=A0A3G3K0G0_9BACL|nr:zf-HC2 domain-containing protein [Cohnella candidum]AYQ74005.1 anti-sigma factor [Cohnella candidum]
MDCKVAVAMMHDYLDGDLDRDDAASLSKHMDECSACQSRYDALARTEALVRAVPFAQAPAGLEERILGALPKTRRRPAAWTGWVRRHPAVSAAALFLIVMLSSFVTMWNQDRQLSVAGPDLENVIIQGSTVIVPEGKEVSGDLTVVNGSAEVLGNVKGDLTVIDGNVTLASTAHIAGHVQEIDRAVDWAWYKVRSWFGTLAYGS